MIFSCNCLVYLENGCTFAPRKRGRCYWNRGRGQVHIDVGLPGDKKRIYFFLKVVAGLKNSCIFAAA